MESWRLLARIEGIFVEPASAAGLAGLKQQIARGNLDATGKQIVVVLTGHGLKDPATAVSEAVEPHRMEASIEALETYLG
jgi:threonine synthase